jgi:hypothetical protein
MSITTASEQQEKTSNIVSPFSSKTIDSVLLHTFRQPNLDPPPLEKKNERKKFMKYAMCYDFRKYLQEEYSRKLLNEWEV